jgi:signal transduction histidine kinase
MRSGLQLLKTSTFRLVLVYLAVFALSVGAVLAYVYWNTALLMERQLEAAVRAEFQALVEEFRESGMESLVQAVRRRSHGGKDAVYLVTNFLGRRLAGNLDGLPEKAVKGEGSLEFTYAVETVEGIERHQVWAYHTQLDNGAVLLVGRDIEEKRRFADLVRRALLLALVITIVLGIAGGLLMSRNFLHRIDTITAASRSIMAGDLSRRVPVSGSGDELDRLAVSLNEMLDQIQRLMTGMREVSTNIAHDLRTPLTRLRARVESALRSAREPKERRVLKRTIEEADHLLATFNALLSIAKTEAGQAREGLKATDLEALLMEIAELFAPLAEEAGGKLTVATAGPVTVLADRQLLAQAVSNLIDNALKYGVSADAGGPQIHLALEARGGEVALVVADRGPGVPASERSRILERFVRLDEARSRPGSGLGLSVVQGIVRLHNGKLVIRDNEPGLRVEMIFPRAGTRLLEPTSGGARVGIA